MTTKPKLNPTSTYVIDESEIEQLDELSLTSMITALVEVGPEAAPEPASDTASPPTGDATINDLLAASSADQQPERSAFSAEPESTGDLLPADVLFPDLKLKQER